MTRIEITHAAFDVLLERRRQIEAEGWTPEHDDQHDQGELAQAGAVYAANAVWADQGAKEARQFFVPNGWPWAREWWKPSNSRRRMLVKAGALILAEIERLDRQTESGGR